MPPRKLNTLSVKEKIAVLDALKSCNQGGVAKQFQISQSAVSRINKNADSLRKQLSENKNSDRKRQRLSANSDVEAAILQWFHEMRAKDVPVNGPMLLEKAQQMAVTLGNKTFQATSGWLERLKVRENLKFKKFCGEKAAADVESAERWVADVLPDLLGAYSPADIYNADETGLYFKATPGGTIAAKGQRVDGGKAQKERLTVLLLCNSDGSDKQVYTVGRFANPRCFKRAKPPVPYFSSRNAWMTSAIWTEILLKLDQKMLADGRKILLFADNASCHGLIGAAKLKNVKLAFLPPNTTSLIQPLDQGVIHALKVHYRTQLVRKMIAAVEDGKSAKEFGKSVSLLDAMHMLKRAWWLAKPGSISNCFRSAGFLLGLPANAAANDCVLEEAEIPATFSAEEFAQLVAIDRDLPCYGELSDADICEQVLAQRASTSTATDSVAIDCEEEEDPVDEEPIISNTTASYALVTLRMYMEQNGFEIRQDFYSLEEKIEKFRCKNLKQMKITDFFK